MNTDYWDRGINTFLEEFLKKAKGRVRISSGYFSVQGYDLIKDYLANLYVEVIAGFDDTSEGRLRTKLITDIMQKLRIWDHLNRRDAVKALVKHIEEKRFIVSERESEDIIEGRSRRRDHAKVFIIDDIYAIVGSGNFTQKGLLFNTEAMVAVVDAPSRVSYWIMRFSHYWNDEKTLDITGELLKMLKAWLEFVSPFDVYLKSLEALVGTHDDFPNRDDYKHPTVYQMVVVERLLRQLQKFGGAMLVASTGLGKTIIATHTAYRLKISRQIKNVIVFAPKSVKTNWENALYSAGVSYRVFTRDLLDWRVEKKAVSQLHDTLDTADESTLIIVDESHHFRNRLRSLDGTTRYSYQRLKEAVNGRNASILLMTATPFAKDMEDLNNQLSLLPHNSPLDAVDMHGQYVFQGMLKDTIRPGVWYVAPGGNPFQSFIELPVCTVISTSQVAKHFAQQTEKGDYIEFGDEKRWIPSVELRKVKVPVPLEIEIRGLIAKGIFLHDWFTFQHRGSWMRSEDSIQRQVEVSWLSSPKALLRVIDKILNREYSVSFNTPAEDLENELFPIRDRLRKITYDTDEKFLTLFVLVQRALSEGKKIIVFTERHATAVYLEEGLQSRLPNANVACMSFWNGQDYELKDFDKEGSQIIAEFAPKANPEFWGNDRPGQEEKHVLVSTDAYGAGINLEDASIVISYDLAWTPDVIIQRAGRIMRLWKDPRKITLVVFIGDFQSDIEGNRVSRGVSNRLEKLISRGSKATQFSEVPLFTDKDIVRFKSLKDLAKNITYEDIGIVDPRSVEEFSGVSSFLNHIKVYRDHEQKVSQLSDDISSAMSYGGKYEYIFTLFRCRNNYKWIVYNVTKDCEELLTEDDLLGLISCEPEAETALISQDQVEQWAQKCRRTLEDQSDDEINSDELERICALYLIPDSKDVDLKSMLDYHSRSGDKNYTTFIP